MQGNIAKPESDDDYEFNAGSDREADGGVNLPVSQFQSKFLGGKEDGKGKKLGMPGTGKDTLEELLNLNEARKEGGNKFV